MEDNKKKWKNKRNFFFAKLHSKLCTKKVGDDFEEHFLLFSYYIEIKIKKEILKAYVHNIVSISNVFFSECVNNIHLMRRHDTIVQLQVVLHTKIVYASNASSYFTLRFQT